MLWQRMRLILLLSATAGITISLAYAVYILTQKEEDEDDEGPKLARGKCAVKTSRNVTIEVKVPKESIGVVIGRGGATIKSISQKSETRINFKNEDETEEFRTCVIRGTTETAQLAESMILEVIKNQPLIEKEDLWVPVSAIGLIIGKGGENIKAMSSMSHAKISVATTANFDSSPERKITIQGTFEQIEMAKALIQEKVAADAEQRQKITQNAANRSPRNKPKHLELSDSAANVEQQHSGPRCEKLISTNSDGFMQVYVSAVCNPSLFWVQMITRKSVDLDRLVDEMTEFYNDETNRKSQAITPQTSQEVVGLKVAARFSMDRKWYRGEVTQVIKEDEYDPSHTEVDVFYVDYGNSDCTRVSELCFLRPDFLKLTFQAIECSLDNVRPKDSDSWSEEATDCFEALTHNAQWKAVMARVCCYKEKGGQSNDSMPIPCVDLVDTAGEKDTVIAQELINRGFAVRVKPEISDMRSDRSASVHLPNNNEIQSNSSEKKKKNSRHTVYTSTNICPAGYEDEEEDEFDGFN